MQMILHGVGQMKEADITFGDLTVFVGPQATGKSIALQFLKLMVDTGYVLHEMKLYGRDWSGRLPEFFDAYFDEGMRSIWKATSSVLWNGKQIDLPQVVGHMRKAK